MQYLLMLLLVSGLLNWANSRPIKMDNRKMYSELEEPDYEKSDEAVSEDADSDDEDTPLNEQVSRDNDQEEGVQQTRFNRNEYYNENRRTPSEEPLSRKNPYEKFSEYKLDSGIEMRDNAATNHQDQSPNSKRRQSDRYVANHNADDQFAQNAGNPSSGFDDTQMQNDVLRNDVTSKRRNDAQSEDDGNLLFENSGNKREQVNKVKKTEHSDDGAEPIGQSQLYRKYYSPVQTENKQFEDNRNDENKPEEFNRDRREVDASSADSPIILENKEKKHLNNDANEDDEAAIKRHIKNLSNDELEELLNSLSEDKRVLLQKIIDKDASNELSIFNKREITKKAEAVEENILMDGGQDSEKDPGPTINLNTGASVSQSTENTETTKATSNTGDIDMGSTKISETNSIGIYASKDSNNANEETATGKLEGNSVAAPAVSATAKNENKREINQNAYGNDESFDSDFIESQDPLNDQSYVLSPDENMSELINDEAELHYNNRNTEKRDTMQELDADLSDSMKSLQESFPKSNPYDDSGTDADSDMAPLIRVKREKTKHAVKKRAAAVLPSFKVDYVPYRAENEDEDNDEGNEFYDDGFFDRTANYQKSNINKLSHHKTLRLNIKDNPNEAKQSNLNLNSDTRANTRSIGSDTDSVLSGVEGVDDNLMLHCGARKKRAVAEGLKLEPGDNLIKEDLLTCPQRMTTSGEVSERTESFPSRVNGETIDSGDVNERSDSSNNGVHFNGERSTAFGVVKESSESFTSGVNYEGNEAYGALPRKYNEELGRYKRIRRLKQSTNLKQLSSTTATVE